MLEDITMPDRLSVLYMPHPVAALHKPSGEKIIKAVGAKHNLRIFDEPIRWPPISKVLMTLLKKPGFSVIMLDGTPLWARKPPNFGKRPL